MPDSPFACENAILESLPVAGGIEFTWLDKLVWARGILSVAVQAHGCVLRCEVLFGFCRADCVSIRPGLGGRRLLLFYFVVLSIQRTFSARVDF
jgi:hypothetical protein